MALHQMIDWASDEEEEWDIYDDYVALPVHGCPDSDYEALRFPGNLFEDGDVLLLYRSTADSMLSQVALYSSLLFAACPFSKSS